MTLEGNYGITEDDKRILSMIHQARTNHSHTKHTTHTRPELGEIVVEARGNTNRRVHLPDPDSDGLLPWCLGRGGVTTWDTEWKSRGVEMARVWREPCKKCFPEGFPDE